jgi:hypothetical protein
MEESRCSLKILTGNLKERYLQGALSVDRRKILELILKK